MEAVALLALARATGLTLTSDGNRLTVHGPRAAALPLLDALREHKRALLALLAEEEAREAAQVAWRVEVLRPHVQMRGPIVLPPVRAVVPPLVSKDGATGALVYGTHCGSCGEPREEGQRFHCRACQRARALVVNEAREGVPIPRALSETGEAEAPSQSQQQPSEPAA